jgi:hypothetical protein
MYNTADEETYTASSREWSLASQQASKLPHKSLNATALCFLFEYHPASAIGESFSSLVIVHEGI